MNKNVGTVFEANATCMRDAFRSCPIRFHLMKATTRPYRGTWCSWFFFERTVLPVGSVPRPMKGLLETCTQRQWRISAILRSQTSDRRVLLNYKQIIVLPVWRHVRPRDSKWLEFTMQTREKKAIVQTAHSECAFSIFAALHAMNNLSRTCRISYQDSWILNST